MVDARQRQWLVDDIVAGEGADLPLVRLVCIDDDDPSRPARVLRRLPHALKWSALSTADATRFQAPYRAGIKLTAHQLTPLMKAMELPRATSARRW